MVEIKITYESLYEVLRKEKNSSDIQKLDSSFFDNVVEYLKTKREILKSQESKDSIFTQVEAKKTGKQIEQIQKILKELYERRENKIIQLAMFSSRMNSDSINENLLEEEKKFYLEIKDNLNKNRNEILNKLISGKTPEKQESKVLKISENEQISTKLVRILQPIPKFVGDDLQIYGPFESEDMVSISEKIADLLIKNNKAEQIKNEDSS